MLVTAAEGDLFYDMSILVSELKLIAKFFGPYLSGIYVSSL